MFAIIDSKKDLVYGIGGTSEDSEWYEIDSGGSRESPGLICNQFGIIQVLQRSPILQTSNWSGTFFAVSYSKPALALNRSSLKPDISFEIRSFFD